MSAEGVRQVLVRAVNEIEFRQILFRDPSAALAGYELSDAEAVSLRGMTPDNFDAVVGEMEQRLSKSSFGLGESDHKIG